MYAPGLCVGEHEHAQPYVGFVLGGTCREHGTGQTFDYEAQNVVVKSPGDRHWNRAGRDGTRYLILELGARPEAEATFEVSRVLRQGGIWGHALRLRSELREPDDAAPLAIESIVLELLADLALERRLSRRAGTPTWIQRARELLHDRRREPLRIAEVAAQVGAHPSRLARAFRAAYGCTPGEYLRRCRLDDAVHWIVRSDRPLSEIALRLGFCDQSHLTRALSRRGITPARLRAASR